MDRRSRIENQQSARWQVDQTKRSVSWLNNWQAASQLTSWSDIQSMTLEVDMSVVQTLIIAFFLSCCFKLRSCAFYWRKARLWKLETRTRPLHWTALITNRYLNACQGSTQSIGSVFRHPIYVQIYLLKQETLRLLAAT